MDGYIVDLKRVMMEDHPLGELRIDGGLFRQGSDLALDFSCAYNSTNSHMDSIKR